MPEPAWDWKDGRGHRPRSLQTLGFELLDLDLAAGTAEAAFVAGEEFGNTVGNVQGGFQAAMLDATLGAAIVSTLEEGQMAPTLELKVSYLRPARIGRFVGRARILRRGGRVAFLEGELCDEDGEVVSRATATFLVTARRKPTD